MLYFGQEMGERGMQTEGFSGLDGRTSIFDWCSVPALRHPDQAVLKRYREVLNLAAQPLFREGKSFDLGYCQDEGAFDKDRHFAWIRSDGKQSCLVVANFGKEADISVRIPAEALDYLGIKPVRTVYTLKVPSHDFELMELH